MAKAFALGEDEVIKVLRPGFPDRLGEHEARVAALVAEAAVAAPRFMSTTRIDGRFGLVNEGLVGPSMMDHLAQRPWEIDRSARRFAELHAAMHEASGTGLSNQKASVGRMIGRAGTELSDGARQAALTRLGALPDGDAICHGDMHPGNILVTASGAVVIDWETASRGDPAGDVARGAARRLSRSQHEDPRRWTGRRAPGFAPCGPAARLRADAIITVERWRSAAVSGRGRAADAVLPRVKRGPIGRPAEATTEGTDVSMMVQAQDLARSFGEIQAVKGVSFEITEGEIFSLLGPNGAGKTTVISMLSCLIPPTSGDATVAGHSIVRDSMAVRRTIGVVPQEIALYDALTARENLTFWGRMYGMGGAALRGRVGEVLDLVGLTDRADQKIRTYSGGMKRRVNIGAGLLHQPRLVFMDEPTVGVDPQSRRSILDSVKELSRAGTTVLYTTHYMEEAQELSDRVGIIDHGELIAIGTQDELTRQVGERETLRLHVGEDQDAGRLAEGLKGASGVLAASAADHEVVVTVARADESVAPVIVRASELGVRVRSVDIEEPNLEAVFLRLTGRALRD